MLHSHSRYWNIWHWHPSISPLAAILRHYINIIWHYGWHILCKAKSQIILPISCIYHQTIFWKCLPAAASNAYSFVSSARSNA
jgi:hypothetical protein